MMKICVLLLIASLPALPQFGDARSLQHQPIKPGMTCASDAYVLTWVAARSQFECLAASGAPTGAAGGVLGGTYPSPTFAGGASFNADATTFLNGAGSFTSPGTANARITFSNVASATMTLTGVAVKAVVTCWDSSVSPARLFIPDSVEQADADTLTFNFSPNATGYCDGSTGIGLTGATGPTGPAGGVTSVFGSTGVITTLASPTFTGTMTVGASLSVDSSTGIATSSKVGNVALSGLTGVGKWTAGVPGVSAAADIVGLFSTCSGTQYLGADGACHTPGATGANAALSNLSAVSINAGLIPQTTLSLGAQATPWQNLYIYGQGTFGSHSIKFDGTPTGNRVITFPDATATVATLDGSQALTNKTYNGNTWTAGTGTLTLAASKVATINNTLTLAGTDSTTMTFPTTSATIARTDAANTFTGTQTIGALVATTFNGNTFTTGTGVLTIAAAKTLTANNTLTLAGTDSTTMTFPTTSATIARTDAANTFTGHQTIEGVTSTGATGSGNLVFSASPTFTGTITGPAITGTTITSSGSLFAGSGQSIAFSSSTRIQAPSNGIVVFLNTAQSDFTRLDFGATGATGPALTTTIQTNPILAVTDATGGKTAVLLPSNFATVSVLPSCATAAFKGSIANVLDATAPAVGVAVTGGGSAFAQLVCNGTNWTVTGI